MTMRIAVAYDCLFPYTTGGGERQYVAFARELVSRGNEVDYLTARQWDDHAPEDEPFRVVETSRRLRLYSPDGVRRTAAAVTFAWGLFRTLRRRRRYYDAVIVSALPLLNVLAARAALLGSGTTVIFDYLEVWPRRQWRAYSGRLMGTVAWLLQRLAVLLSPVATCHSRLSARRLRAEGFRGRLLVSPGLIDTAAPPRPAGAVADPPYVLYVGRHIPDKRVESLPGAVAHARARVPGLRLIILGEGPSGAEVRSAATAARGEDWTDFLGFVSQERLDELMSAASVVVNPSRREGYGLVVVESAMHGTPVVLVADEGNASVELVEPGRNGYIAPSVGAVDLGDAIARAVLGGADLRRSTSDWYREAIETRTIRQTVGQIAECIDEMAHARATQRTGKK